MRRGFREIKEAKFTEVHHHTEEKDVFANCPLAKLAAEKDLNKDEAEYDKPIDF